MKPFLACLCMFTLSVVIRMISNIPRMKTTAEILNEILLRLEALESTVSKKK